MAIYSATSLKKGEILSSWENLYEFFMKTVSPLCPTNDWYDGFGIPYKNTNNQQN